MPAKNALVLITHTFSVMHLFSQILNSWFLSKKTVEMLNRVRTHHMVKDLEPVTWFIKAETSQRVLFLFMYEFVFNVIV